MPTFRIRKIGVSVYLLCTYNRKHLKIFTGVKVPDDQWDKDHIRKSHPQYEALNCVLQNCFTRLVNAVISIKTRGFEPTLGHVNT